MSQIERSATTYVQASPDAKRPRRRLMRLAGILALVLIAWLAPGALAVLIALGATALWALGALPLLQSLRRDESQNAEAQQMYHAVWTGVVMLVFAVIGTVRYSAC